MYYQLFTTLRGVYNFVGPPTPAPPTPSLRPIERQPKEQASPIGGWGVLPPTPSRDGPKNQLTFLFKAFFNFFR